MTGPQFDYLGPEGIIPPSALLARKSEVPQPRHRHRDRDGDEDDE